MSLTPEWRGRIDHWKNTLQKLIYVKLGDVPLEGFVTSEQLTPQQAQKRKFRPMPPGTAWGAKWEYAWFRGVVRLPREAAGERIVFLAADPHANPGESRVIVNGREVSGCDWAHKETPLTLKGAAGARYEILVEMYAGHGSTPCGTGPVPLGHVSVPEPPPRQQTVKPASYGIWREDMYQAWMDVQTLLEARDHLDPDSLRVAELDAALRDFTLIADLERPVDEMLASVRAARRRLQPLLARRNSSTTPALYCFGHAHIDVAWLWPLQETERKCARTFSTQLTLMEMYPEYKFLQSQPHLYRMAQRRHPDIYRRIKAAVRRGQWMPEGGMWVEADTNISGGESLIRQFLHGKRFFRDEFGVESELLWLPDVFGYSGALPQIMAGCGVRCFSTSKIFWTYNGGDPFPFNTFWWEGIDGTRVFAHLHNDYNGRTNPASLIGRWKQRVQKDGITARLFPFGYGDGGGGATRDHLEFLRRQRDLEGVPRAKIAPPAAFFRHEMSRGVPFPVYVGELYFQAHRGTYTSQARTKRWNRRNELALREAEMWGAAAMTLAGFRYPRAAMDRAWKGVLLNQFHDIIPGSSIERVYEETEAQHAEIFAAAQANASRAACKLVRRNAKAVTAFNSLSWNRTALVPLPKGFRGAAADGQPLPSQRIGGTVHAEATVPSCGWITLRAAKPATAANTLKVTAAALENEHLRLRLNARGEIASLTDKATAMELAASPLNSLRLYKDVPQSWDAWDVDSTYKLCPVPLRENARIEVVATGPLVGIVRVTRRAHNSTLVQDIRLRRDSRRVEFVTRVDWRERHKLLKVNFATNIHAPEALHEIQFGHLSRPGHQSRPFDVDRFEVSNHKWTALAEEKRGAAVLNDCKYGVNVESGSINLTLLRAPLAPDMHADQGAQEFTYALYVWHGPFADCDVVREAYDINVAPLTVPGYAGAASLLRVDAPNVVVEAVKPAEDGSGDIIVRLYESKRTTTKCCLTPGFPVRKAQVTNMIEEDGRKTAMRGRSIPLSFRPFEIKTLRLKP